MERNKIWYPAAESLVCGIAAFSRRDRQIKISCPRLPVQITYTGEHDGLVKESLTPERDVGGSIPTSPVVCP